MMNDATPSRRELLAGGAAAAALFATGSLAHANDQKPAAPVPQAPKQGRPVRQVHVMPTAYVSHGSPMLAVDTAKGRELTAWAARHPKPVAVLAISAHFEKSPITIGATTRRPLIYDFGGFPKALYQIKYGAPGAPKLAARVQQLLAPKFKIRRDARRGHDHGTWVPMRWMYPRADVPLLSLSLPTHDPKALYRMGRALRPLRDQGVLILGSGAMTHNLRRRVRTPGTKPPTWASEFDQWSREVCLKNNVDALLDWQKKAPAARTNHPTVEHFVPLILAAGARKDSDVVTFPVEGFEGRSFSRRCVDWATPIKRPAVGG